MSESEQWFIVKQSNGQCAIVPDSNDIQANDIQADGGSDASESGATEQWGPFASQAEAIARRVGLIRAGKCQPA